MPMFRFPEREGEELERAIQRVFLEISSMVLELWIYDDETVVTTLLHYSR